MFENPIKKWALAYLYTRNNITILNHLITLRDIVQTAYQTVLNCSHFVHSRRFSID